MTNQKDPIWWRIQEEAAEIAASEPVLSSFVHTTVLNHETLLAALSFHLANKLTCDTAPALLIREVFDNAFNSTPAIAEQVRADIQAFYDRDSACDKLSTPFLYYKGFHALEAWRAAHWLWQQGKRSMALMLQSRISALLSIDIHPAAQIGKGVMFDHGSGIVIGETAVVEDCVSIMQSVTLGGTGKESGDRHPKIRRGVLIGPGAKILGNIEVGAGSKITAASVVLKSVPAHSVVAGVPAEVIGEVTVPTPSELMDQGLGGCASK